VSGRFDREASVHDFRGTIDALVDACRDREGTQSLPFTNHGSSLELLHSYPKEPKRVENYLCHFHHRTRNFYPKGKSGNLMVMFF
jgi:hypothetical protein